MTKNNTAQEILGVVDDEAERICIAAMLKDERRADDIIARLHPDMFSELHRQLIFRAVKELRAKGMVVTPTSVVTMAAQVASRERIKENRVTARVVDQFFALSIEGKDVIAYAMQLAFLQPYRGAAEDVETVMRLVARRADEREIHAELMALLAKLSQQRFQEESNVYLGSEMGQRMRTLLEESRNGILSPIYWPWVSMGQVAPRLPRGFCMLLGMMDGQGKCLGKGTKVLMYDGTLVAVENIKVGDKLMGPDSTPRIVLSLTRGRDQMYMVRQNKGIDYRCNSKHLLSLNLFDRHGGKEKRTVEAKQAASWSDSYIRACWQGYKVAVDWPEQSVPIDPYFLGLWLGDGSTAASNIYTPEPEIISWLEDYAKEVGCGIRITPNDDKGVTMKVCVSNGTGHSYRGSGAPGGTLGEMGLLGDKRIPQEYITNSRRVRLQLLAGLLDTDGYLEVDGTGYEITQKKESLARQIKLLADSLGFSTRLTEKTATIKSIGYECQVWRLKIYGDTDSIPCIVSRKQAKQRVIDKDWRVTGISVEEDGFDDYYGFMLDGDHEFLLEDMTVTHNSTVMEHVGRYNARKGAQVVHVATEYVQRTRDARQMGQIAGISAKKILVDGGYTPQQEAQLEKAIQYAERELQTYHFVHAGGKNIDEILGTLYAMPVVGDIYILDYIQDLAYSRDDRPGDENGRGNNAMRKWHAFLEARNAVGIVVSQSQKTAHEITSLEELTRKLLLLGSPAISKSQLTVMGYRKTLSEDGGDPDWDASGQLMKPVGRKGQLSRLLGLNVNKSSLGMGGFTYLDYGNAQIIRDIPERALDAIMNRVSSPFNMNDEILAES